jgi:hypothetical protein
MKSNQRVSLHPLRHALLCIDSRSLAFIRGSDHFATQESEKKFAAKASLNYSLAPTYLEQSHP